ncbi:hypothetical protein ALC60_09224 [Trachymyrmex zeteki]|uniref:Uncharacterized protein n=1 Tax=Mycetomoellerius zeteki TaxID=64791 RepID=A0A151WV20_9HYME|nr:hypothetical protein ALC60_09224 [Trachymyrmex zeteki]
MTQNTLGPQKASIHHWLCTRNWEEKKRDRGRDATRFWQTHLNGGIGFRSTTEGRQPYVFFLRDDSYQTENKGSVTMNKKKPLSVSNPSILGRSNYTQLARLRRRIDRCNKQLLLLNTERHIRCLAMKVPFVVAIIVKNVDSQRVLYLVFPTLHKPSPTEERRQTEAAAYRERNGAAASLRRETRVIDDSEPAGQPLGQPAWSAGVLSEHKCRYTG